MPKRDRNGLGQQSGPRRRADQRELLERHLDRSGAGPLPDDDVELVVLHRRIQHFLDRRRHPVDLVDEQHVVLAEARQNRREIARPLEHRPRRRAHGDAELLADDIGERRLAETGRSVEQHVIERFAALARGGNRDLKIRANALLADVVVQRAGPEPRLVLNVFIDPRQPSRSAGPRMLEGFYETASPSAIFALIFWMNLAARPARSRGPERIVPLRVGDAVQQTGGPAHVRRDERDPRRIRKTFGNRTRLGLRRLAR